MLGTIVEAEDAVTLLPFDRSDHFNYPSYTTSGDFAVRFLYDDIWLGPGLRVRKWLTKQRDDAVYRCVHASLGGEGERREERGERGVRKKG